MSLLGTDPPGTKSAASPAAIYLSSLAGGSRRTMRQVLDLAASMICPGADADTLPWASVRYEQITVVRSGLSSRAPATANKVLAAVRGVLRQAFSIGEMTAEDYQRALSVRSVRGRRVVRGRAVTQDELRKMFSACDVKTAAGARDAALLAVAYGAGLRRSELTGLDVADYDAMSGHLVVRGKGNTERRAFVANEPRSALGKWLAARGDRPGPIFLPVDKTDRVHHRRMSEQAVYMVLRRLGRRAGVRRFSPHDLRRTFIGDLLDAGVDIVTVQALAAHVSVSTTARYDRRPERTRRQAVELLRVPFGEYAPK